MKDLLINAWWAIVLVVVAVLEHRLGKKQGRRIGYAEGLEHGREDALRQAETRLEHGREDALRQAETRLAEVLRASSKDWP